MYRILERKQLNPASVLLKVEAPLVARHARAGQFVILRADGEGERIPLTIADWDEERGTVSVIFQTVGAATEYLARKREGDFLPCFAGPLGKPTETEGFYKVAVIGGGAGCAVALPAVRAFARAGAEVTAIVGFRSRDLVMLEEELRASASRLLLTSDDGSFGEKGRVTQPLARLLEEGERFDEVLSAGPLPMMKAVAETTRPYAVRTVASMNPVMIDGTGMCGCCRLTVGGKTVFACVDGPDLDAHLVDFDEAIARSRLYLDFERRARERACKLLALAKEEK